MIAYLRGSLVEKNIDNVVIDVNGVGYGVFVTSGDLPKLEKGKQATLYICEHIREQAHDLFGFVDTTTKAMFEKLTEVNGIGPKMALNLLSLGSLEKLKLAISTGDIHYIQGASGVGKRVAERVVVDLKDKVGLMSSDAATGFLQSSEDDEAFQALVALGFSEIEAGKALSDIDKSLAVEEKVKRALRRKN